MTPNKVRQIRLMGGRLPFTEKHARTIENKPGASTKLNPLSRKLINDEHDRLYPSPLKEPFRELRNELIELKKIRGNDRLKGFIKSHIELLEKYCPSSVEEEINALYILALVHISAARSSDRSDWFDGPAGWRKHLVKAEQALRRSRKIANKTDLSLLPEEERNNILALKPYLYTNLIVVMAERAKLGYGRSHATMKKLIIRAKTLDALWSILQENPHLWQACWNGLELSSRYYQEDHKYMLRFYQELIKINPGYQDFDNFREEAPSIREEEGMSYFYHNYYSKYHKPIQRNLKVVS